MKTIFAKSKLIILLLILTLLCGCSNPGSASLSPGSTPFNTPYQNTPTPFSESTTVPAPSCGNSDTPRPTTPHPETSETEINNSSTASLPPTPSATPTPVTGVSQKYDYRQLKNDISLLSQKYPDKITVSSIGFTGFEREIPLIILGNPSAGKRVLIHGAMHAREYITSQVIMLTLERYLRDYDSLTYKGIKYSDILDQTAIYIVPMVNPDGVELVNNGISSVPEGYKDIVMDINNGRTDFSQWKANGLGVDLNNNYGIKGSIDGGSYAVSASPMGYPGSEAFSEPETAALADLTSEMDFLSTASYHTKGKIIYWYFGQTGEAETRDKAYAQELAALTGYSLVSKNGSQSDNLAMGYKDWYVQAFERPGFTIECGSGSHPLPVSQLNSIYQAVKYVPIHMAWREYE